MCTPLGIKRGRRDELIIVRIMSLKLLVVGVVVVAFRAPLVAAQGEQLRFGWELPKLSLERIVGGSAATKGEFPYQVSLQWGLPPLAPLRHFCGGSIIDERWILTAGHCVLAVPSYGTFVVKAGKHEIKLSESTEKVVAVDRSFVHKDYVGNVAPYDVALLKLKSPLTFDGAIAKINLPTAGDKPTGITTLSGWGSISGSGSTMPSTLQKADLPVVDFETCKKALEDIVGPSPLHRTNVCTGPLTGGVSACSGDSGGPLVKRNASGFSEVVGIASWAVMPCGTKGAPSVFTEVASFVDWIRLTIENNSKISL